MTLPANYEQDIRRLLEANKFQYHHHHQQEQQQQRRCCLGIYSTLYSNENFIPCLSNQALRSLAFNCFHKVRCLCISSIIILKLES